MNFPGNLLLIGKIDISELRTLVIGLSEEQWQSLETRQQRYEVHKHTQTIGLVYDPDFRHSHPTRLPALVLFENIETHSVDGRRPLRADRSWSKAR